LTDIGTSPPCVVFALAREAMAFRAPFPTKRQLRRAPCRAWLAGTHGRTVLVLETGIGRRAMEASVAGVLGRPGPGGKPYRPPFLVLAGFSGGLRRGLDVGSVILATEVVDEHEGRWPTSWPAERTTNVRQGRVLTTDTIVAEPARKHELGVRYGALAVDMESAAAARVCHERGVPFGCLRAISDDVDSRLPPTLVGLLQGGRPSPLGILAAILREPRIVGAMLRLAKSTRLAAQRLAATLDQLIPADAAGA
jgi:adenosylhomocysteine nucleosidase